MSFSGKAFKAATELGVVGAIFGPQEFSDRYRGVGWWLVKFGFALAFIFGFSVWAAPPEDPATRVWMATGIVAAVFCCGLGLFIVLLSLLTGHLFRRY